MKMKQWINRTYFSLQDVKDELGILPSYSGPYIMMAATGLNKTTLPDFLNLVLQDNNKTEFTDSTLNTSTYLFKVWSEHIWPRFYDQAICYADNIDLDDDPALKAFLKKVGSIYSWMKSTNDTYSVLINNLETNKATLLKSIQNSTLSTFNDTPQNDEGGAYDSHTTTVTNITTNNDGSTIMSRIKEVENNISELYTEWADDFMRKFIILSI